MITVRAMNGVGRESTQEFTGHLPYHWNRKGLSLTQETQSGPDVSYKNTSFRI